MAEFATAPPRDLIPSRQICGSNPASTVDHVTYHARVISHIIPSESLSRVNLRLQRQSDFSVCYSFR